MAKVTGIVKIYIDGKLRRSKEGASLDLGGRERTLQVGHAVYGASEKFMPSMIECTLAHMSDTDPVALNALEGVTVRFECDSGPTYLCTNMYSTAPCKITAGEGDCTLALSGDPAVEE